MAAERRATKARTKAMRDNMGASHMEMVVEIKPEWTQRPWPAKGWRHV
jgi:hypothetical protein